MMMKTVKAIFVFIIIAGAFWAMAEKDNLPATPIAGDTIRLIHLNDSAQRYFDRSMYDSCMIVAGTAFSLSDSLINSMLLNGDTTLLKRVKYFKALSLTSFAEGLHYSDAGSAFDTLETAVSLMKETGNKRYLAAIYQTIANLSNNMNLFEKAMEYDRRSLEIYRETGELNKQAVQLLSIGITHRYTGNYGDALEYAVKALKISRQINDSANMIEVLLAMGFTYMFVEKWEDALKVQQQALEIYRKMGDSSGIARIYNDMGATNISSGNLPVALEQHKKALDIRLKSNDYYYTSASYAYIGNIYEKLNQFSEAIQNYRSSLDFAIKNGSKTNITHCYLDLGRAYVKNSEPENARRQFESALEISREMKNLTGEVNASLSIARIYQARNEHHKALYWLGQAEKTAPNSMYLYLEEIYQSIAETYFKLGDFRNAYVNMLKYNQCKDSLMVTENLVKITTLTNRLEFENKQALQNESHEKTLALKQAQINREKVTRNFSLFGMTGAIVFVIILSIRFVEKKRLNTRLKKTLGDLKSMQSQLIHAEKMASLGELTAGIAHEIQNPLNFVNNFSEVSSDLLAEMREHLDNGNQREAMAIVRDLSQNLEKISQHGKRAGSIVRGMLEHSRSSPGQHEPTDLNALAEEYLRLAYHGLRAKDKSFHSDYKMEADSDLPKVKVVPQEMGRVLLNLINNAFYAVALRKSDNRNGYNPSVVVRTRKLADKVEIRVKDNGGGIPQNVREKIFQPFFTTKPSGQGTGLGLSLSYDIITKGHGGELKVETTEGTGTEFIIVLPI